MQSTALKRFFKIFIWLFTLLTAVKILIVGYDIDEQYAIALSYRLLKGDFPLLTMWEPHQTSCFLAAALMAPFIKLTGGLTGVVLYLRVCGLVLHILVTCLLYRYLSSRLDRDISLLLALLSFFSLPKLMFLPEFSNLQLWFLYLLILCFLNYYGSKSSGRSLWFLIGAGVFLALEVLTYPSTVLMFPVCLFFLFRYRKSRQLMIKELAAFVLPCIAGAGCFLGWLLSEMSLGQLLSLLPIAASDGSHSASLAQRLVSNGASLLTVCCFLLAYGAVTCILYYSMRRFGRQVKPSILFLLCTLTGQVLIWIFGNGYPNYPLVEYFLIPILLLYYALRRKVASSPELSFFVILPFVAFLGITFFTNHPLMVSAPFLIPCVTGILSLPELGCLYPTEGGLKKILLFWVMVLLFGKCYMIRTTGGVHYTCFDSLSLMRRGPASGIIADTDSVCRYRDNLEFVSETLPKGAKVFYVGVSNDLYLMQDIEICTPSTISSPTFDEKITEYFALNPEKKPEYLVCDTGLQENEWVASYLAAHFESLPIAENDYLLIYRLLP